jgi:hypothetical protein
MGATLSYGVVTVTEQVLAYQRKRLASHEVLDLEAVDLPPTSFTTRALWYELEPGLLAEDFPLEVLLGTLHAAEHAQIAVLPLIAMCDRWDIGGLSTNLHPQTGGPTIFIYDGHPGGIGITRVGFAQFEQLVADAHRSSPSAAARRAARRACSRPSAATSTSRWPRTAPARCSRGCSSAEAGRPGRRILPRGRRFGRGTCTKAAPRADARADGAQDRRRWSGRMPSPRSPLPSWCPWRPASRPPARVGRTCPRPAAGRAARSTAPRWEARPGRPSGASA